MAATGLGPGTHLLGDQEVTVGPDGPRIGIETLAGSTLTMPAAIINLMGWTGAGPEDARGAASRAPADLIGAADRGRLGPGMRADLVLLDPMSRVRATWVAGEKVYEAP
jgi:N-acetylglucosamine-6-phosphate deacetylase